MKKFRFSRMMALLLALVLCLSAVQMPVAMAADDSDGVPDVTDADLDNTGANTPAPVERKFDVWAPQYLDIVLKSDGTLELPTGDRARIYNKSTDIAVQVSEISVEALNGWILTSWTADFAASPVDSKNVALKLRGDVLDSGTGKLALTKDRWVIEADNYLDLEFEAKIPDFNTKQDSVPVARVTFKLAWGEPVVAAKTFKIDFEDRDGGKIADLTTLETDENGIVPTLPAVTVDDGYTFDHYEDETGRTVKAGDKIAEDVKLHPILTKTEPEPEKNLVISFEDRDGGKIADTTPIECPDKLVPEKLPEVTPDDEHEFKGWADADDNPVEPGDKLDGDITLHPVFVEKPDPEPEPEKAPVISFEDRDGGEIADKTPIECPDGVVPKLPAVTPDAKHEFVGWADADDKPVKEGDPIDADVTLHPVFTEKVPIISFEDDTNGSVDDKNPIECLDGVVPALPGTTPGENYEFDHWEDADGNIVAVGDKITADITLRPVFTEKAPDLVTVTFKASQYNGTLDGDASVSVPVGTTWGDVKKPATKPGLSASFMGWETAAENQSGEDAADVLALSDDYVISEDMTAVAQFKSWFAHTDDTVTGFSDAYAVAGSPVDVTIPVVIDGKTMTTIGRAAFGKSSLETVVVQDGYKKFDEHAFRESSKLRSCNLPDSLTHLMAYVFKDTALEGDVYLSDNLEVCGGCAFSCTNITSISISGKASNGATGGEHCVAYGLAEYCSKLRIAEIRSGAVKTMVGVFRGCKALERIILPGTLTEIQNYFVGASGDDSHCENLKTVYFGGSRSAWDSIKIVYHSSVLVDQNNMMLKSADKSYNSRVTLRDFL